MHATVMSLLFRYLRYALPGLLTACSLTAQPVDRVLSATRLLARFEEARALSVDPGGALYVVDAGRDVVYQLGPDGRVRFVLGGTGTGEGAFDEPRDLDPTNGLLFVVADAGNGRLQRFSRQFQFLESLPVGRKGTSERGPSYLSRESGLGNPADGRPIAVLTTPSDEMFAIDEARHVVLRWGRDRRPAGAIGGPDDGEGALVAPVSLASDGRVLYVADRGRHAVLVYDLFGGYIRSLGEGIATDVEAVFVKDRFLWVVLPHRLLVYETTGVLRYVFDIRLPEPLVDAALSGRTLYLLSARGLYASTEDLF